MKAFRAILYKEDVKTKASTRIALTLAALYLLYSLYLYHRTFKAMGASHLWNVMIERNVIFVDKLKYVPMILAFILASSQVLPEALMKRLKLTLHLPLTDAKTCYYMLSYGLFILLGYNFLYLIGSSAFFLYSLPWELTSRILISMLPWSLASFAMYFFCFWVGLQTRLLNVLGSLVLSVAMLSLYYLAESPDAYPFYMLILLLLLTLLAAVLPLYSIRKFRRGA